MVIGYAGSSYEYEDQVPLIVHEHCGVVDLTVVDFTSSKHGEGGKLDEDSFWLSKKVSESEEDAMLYMKPPWAK